MQVSLRDGNGRGGEHGLWEERGSIPPGGTLRSLDYDITDDLGIRSIYHLHAAYKVLEMFWCICML